MKRLKDISTTAPKNVTKRQAGEHLMELHKELFSLQNLLYAQKKYALLIILQGVDTSGKDGTIRHVFSCVNPQGCRVKSFKTPTEEELLHDFLWRIYPHLPERGMMQIFNRSHYEDIIFPLVHNLITSSEIGRRHEVINHFEEHLQHNKTVILKFFLHIARKEQKGRIAERLKNPIKRWKYDPTDGKEAAHWDRYIEAYQTMIDGCQPHNPWTIVAADQKWYRNYFIASTIVERLKNLKMSYPVKT